MQKSLHSKPAGAAGLIVLTVGLCVLISWQLNWDPGFLLGTDWIVMKANTAFAFTLVGVSLYLVASQENGSGAHGSLSPPATIAKSCAFLALMIGLITLIEYFSGFNLGIDQIWAVEPEGAAATSHPGRMAPSTALCFMLTGSALLLPDQLRWQRCIQILAMLSGLIGLLLMLGYIYEARLLTQYTRMALHTALLFILLSVGILCLHPETGLPALFSSDGMGGMMIRRLLPAILFIPIVMGGFRLQAELAGWFGAREGVTLFAFSNIVLLGTMAWITARQLHKLDLVRKQTSEHLRTSLQEVTDLKTALDEHAIVAVTNPRGLITYVNDKFCHISKYSREELLGHDHRIINSGHHPKEFIHDLWHTISQGKTWKGEIKNKAKDGSYYWVDTTIVPFLNERGKPRQYVAVRADITAHKNAEEEILKLNTGLEQHVIERTAQLEQANTELRHSRAELNNLFEALPGLYLVLTVELKIVAVSDSYLKATMTTREGIMRKHLFEVFPDNPEEVAATGVSNLRASLDRVINNGKSDTMAIQKYDVKRPDGVFEERYWSPINSPVFGADKQIRYIVHRVEEVTEFMQYKSKADDKNGDFGAHLQQMEAEIFQSSQKLQATNRQLESANKELESFSYSVSHDLRAPLRAIAGFTQVLHTRYRQHLDESGENYLNRVMAAANRMSELIDDLLRLSRVNRSEFNPQPVDLSAMVKEITETLSSTNPEREAEFIIPPDITTNGDPRLLRIALENLLGNAWKFTSKKSKTRIEFGTTNHAQKGPALFIRDNGAGFEMDYAHKLFGPFQRLHAIHEFPGTGIGLAIVQRIINRHNGTIWPESRVDEGATFYFTLNDIPISKQP